MEKMLKRNIKEEERIERIIRGLIKLPDNKRCINCNSLGPQYVCTTFWTFVCTNCSGVHREFTHRVKSISMAKFSADEVAALQAGGNEQARKTYFKTWDPRRNSFPDSSNLHRLRDFIRHVYVDMKYSGERNNENVSLNKAGAEDEDDYSVQRPSEKPNQVARKKFSKLHTTGKTDQAQRHESYDLRFGNFHPMSSDRTFRYYVEERSSPQYRQANLKSLSRRKHTAHFEVVDDRFREDGVRSGRRLESNRFSDADSRARSSSPVSEKGRSKTCPPPVYPVKDILANNVPHLELGEPPKANGTKNSECSTQVQKVASFTSPESTDRKEKVHMVNALNLIDFDADPEPIASSAVMQTQEIVPSSEGSNSSAPTSRNEKTSNTPKVNSMDFLLFELASPSVGPLGNVYERPPEGNTPAATEGSSNAEVDITPASTANASLDSNYVRTTNASTIQSSPVFPHVRSHSVSTVTQAHQLPAMFQNQSFAVPPGNGRSTLLQTSSSAPSLYKQPFFSEPADIKGPQTHVSSEKPSQDFSNLAQDTSSGNESISRGRKELPADIFTTSHLSFVAAVPGWQLCPPYTMGYGTMVSRDSMKSRNPFNLGDDGSQFQAPTFPSMSSFREALPSISASQGPWTQQLPRPFTDNSQGMSYGMIPPDAYMRKQLPNNMTPSIPQTETNAGESAEAFASLNPIQHSIGLNPASAGPTSYPSTRENPFG